MPGWGLGLVAGDCGADASGQVCGHLGSKPISYDLAQLPFEIEGFHARRAVVEVSLDPGTLFGRDLTVEEEVQFMNRF